MCDPVSATVGAAAVLGGAQIYQARQAAKKQESAMRDLNNRPPPPTPTPPASPADPSPDTTIQQRQKRLAAFKYGFASTMTARDPSTLGAPAAPGLKTKLGQ